MSWQGIAGGIGWEGAGIVGLLNRKRLAGTEDGKRGVAQNWGKRHSGRMLRWRLILSVVFIAGLGALCWLDWRAARPGIVLLPLAIVAAMLAAGELLAMFRKRGHEPLAWVVYGGVLVTLLAAALPGIVAGAG